jgi:hypothetical protein
MTLGIARVSELSAGNSSPGCPHCPVWTRIGRSGSLYLVGNANNSGADPGHFDVDSSDWLSVCPCYCAM